MPLKILMKCWALLYSLQHVSEVKIPLSKDHMEVWSHCQKMSLTDNSEVPNMGDKTF